MKLLDVVNAPWAIRPESLREIQEIYATHLRGEKIDTKAVEARIGKPLVNEQRAYEVLSGVAVLPLVGVMAKRANLFMEISGGVSMEIAARELRAAIADPNVHSVILLVDSPGGTVDGTQALANEVSAAASVKPVVTLASGVMASAAYWVGSASQRVYIAEDTTLVGSIGVVQAHVDVSKAEEARGIKTTEIYAGKFKRIATQYGPLSDAGRQTLQEQVDYVYSMFVGAVAKQRGVSEETVLNQMADGRLFVGRQAVDAGLVDGVSTLDELIDQLNQDRGRGPSGSSRAGVARLSHVSTHVNNPKEQPMSMTKEQVAKDHPEIAAAFRADGASAERERIQAIEATAVKGHETLIATLKFDGKSTAGDAALAILAAEQQQRAAAAAAAANEAPAPVALAPTKPVQQGADATTATDAAAYPVAAGAQVDTERLALHNKALKYQADHPGTDYLAAVQAVSKG